MKHDRDNLIGRGYTDLGLTCFVFPTPWLFEPGDIPGRQAPSSGGELAASGMVGRWRYNKGSYEDDTYLRADGTAGSRNEPSNRETWKLEGTSIVIS